MSKHYRYWFLISALAALTSGVLVYALQGSDVSVDRYSFVDRVVKIRPDYSGTVIPPNIAPLNFIVQEKGIRYCVRISSRQGKPIEIFSRSAKIVIPQKQWHELLDENKGRELYFDVFVKTQAGQWNRFEAITNKIADEPIDDYLVYRTIHPLYSHVGQTGIYQRNLNSYRRKAVIESQNANGTCLNCHSFCNHRTDKMIFGTRSEPATILVQNGRVSKLGTKFGYTSWHPSGRLAVYSLNKVRQFFHTARNEVRDVVDLDSTLVYYVLDSGTVKTSPQLSRKDYLETFPTWSPDGRYLYFSSAPILWSDREKVPPENWQKVRYDLMRISYDVETDTWGELETILSAEDTALSILEPRLSPDGRWLLFCMCDYSCWAAYRDSADLYIMDLEASQRTGQYEYRRLDNINSDRSESWHSFSSNSRWVAFSSKRGTGQFTRIYLGYIDQNGRDYKPILLPQKDPSYYDHCLWTIGVGELVSEPVRVREEKLARAVIDRRRVRIDLPITMATPNAGPMQTSLPWQGGRE